MARKLATLFTSMLWLAQILSAQGLTTNASKDDWEDINFEFNSPILSDGYPSLLRLAELLNRNADYKVSLSGHADHHGSHPFNDQLGQKRAGAVKAFLEKYGARAGQISIASGGKRTPKASNTTDEGRFINRRVEMQVTDGAGKLVGAGGPNDIIKIIEAAQKKQEECCSMILKRLDKLDDILAMLKGLKADNDQLKRDIAELKSRPGGMGGQGGPGGSGAAAAKPANDLTRADMERIAERAAQKAFDDLNVANRKGTMTPAELDDLALRAGRTAIADARAEGKTMNPQQMEELATLAASKALQKAVDAGKAKLSPSEIKDMADRAGRRATDEALGRVSPSTLEDVVRKVSQGEKAPSISLLGFNTGVDQDGKSTITGAGRFFKPITKSAAVQAQGEALYFRDRKEGQFDIGLVNRWYNMQLGGFASFKGVGLREMDKTGVLAQYSVTGDYLFKHGKVGFFATKGFGGNSLVKSERPSKWILDETFLRTVDQFGASTALQLHPRVVFEGNLAHLRRFGGTNKPGGTMRFVFPVNNMFAVTAEGGFNETLVGNNANGRATFGILFGNYLQPREYLNFGGPVPVDIPRVRYEVLTRRTRTGNDAPVADAGADRFNVPAGQVVLNGSGSFDPDGDPIKFQWTQVAGPTVSLSNAASAQATFTAAAGQSYGFRLTVTDDRGAAGIARVTISTRDAVVAKVARFLATPDRINPGGFSQLNYNVEGADSVTISGVTGNLDARSGSVRVTPTTTTSYTLTARNATSSDTATVTVVVDPLAPRVTTFSATPASILAGQKSTLRWTVADATGVDISGVGAFQGTTGSVDVSPERTTVYTLIARSAVGTTSATTTVTVITGERPQILSFSGNPLEIPEGGTSTLTWAVRDAKEVTISNNVGKVNLTGSAPVMPSTTTTYTLTAKNDFGDESATVTIVVHAKPKITRFIINPLSINPGQPITYTWDTENADYVFIDNGVGNRIASGALTSAGPIRNTTYTLTAVGKGGQVQAQQTVTVSGAGPHNQTPVARIQPNRIITQFREVSLNGAGSFDPLGGALTYSWRSVDNKGTVVNPTSATPTVQLKQPFTGVFVFELQVTATSGLSSKELVTVELVPVGQPDKPLPLP